MAPRHPNYTPYVLTLISANNWTMVQAVFGSTISAPAAPTVTNSVAGSWAYSYVVTSIDATGQESAASAVGTVSSKADIRVASAAPNIISWTAVAGAVAYNVYEAILSTPSPAPTGSQFGFVGTTQGVSFSDTNIAQNFSLTPPIARNPFTGYTVASVTIGARGTYLAAATAPTVSSLWLQLNPCDWSSHHAAAGCRRGCCWIRFCH